MLKFIIIYLLFTSNNKKDHIRGERIHFYARGVGGSDRVDQLIAYNKKHPAMTLGTFASFREEFNDTDVSTLNTFIDKQIVPYYCFSLKV